MLDSNVQLTRPASKPHPAASLQQRGLLDLNQPEHFAKEPPCFTFAIWRRGELDVVEFDEPHAWDASGFQGREAPLAPAFRYGPERTTGQLLCK